MKMLHSHCEGQVKKKNLVKTITQESTLWNLNHTGTVYELKKLYPERHIPKSAMKQSLNSLTESPLRRREVCQALCLSSPTILQSSELSQN